MITLNITKVKPWHTTAIISAGLWMFAFFIHSSITISLAGLTISAITIALYSGDILRLFQVTGLLKANRHFLITLILCVIAGGALGMYLNHYKQGSFLPSTLTVFALIAVGIGALEELVFRGILLGILSDYRGITAIVTASASHTIYKILVLSTFPVALDINILTLTYMTFGVGLLAGWARKSSASVIPPVIGHMVFDLIVYGGLSSAPVWVWG